MGKRGPEGLEEGKPPLLLLLPRASVYFRGGRSGETSSPNLVRTSRPPTLIKAST